MVQCWSLPDYITPLPDYVTLSLFLSLTSPSICNAGGSTMVPQQFQVSGRRAIACLRPKSCACLHPAQRSPAGAWISIAQQWRRQGRSLALRSAGPCLGIPYLHRGSILAQGCGSAPGLPCPRWLRPPSACPATPRACTRTMLEGLLAGHHRMSRWRIVRPRTSCRRALQPHSERARVTMQPRLAQLSSERYEGAMPRDVPESSHLRQAALF